MYLRKILIFSIITFFPVNVIAKERNEIIKRLKETKELYDEGILNKEEYEKETSKLKSLLIGN